MRARAHRVAYTQSIRLKLGKGKSPILSVANMADSRQPLLSPRGNQNESDDQLLSLTRSITNNSFAEIKLKLVISTILSFR